LSGLVRGSRTHATTASLVEEGQVAAMTRLPPSPVDDPAIKPLLTAARLSTYLRATNNDQGRAMRPYAWNIEASAAMWGDFSVLEVCVRNAIGGQLERYAGRADWWAAPVVALLTEQHQASGSRRGRAMRTLAFRHPRYEPSSSVPCRPWSNARLHAPLRPPRCWRPVPHPRLRNPLFSGAALLLLRGVFELP
ncbi:MAG: hypothetical protein LBE08_10635, partial [Bifidobacteriaceae bacterium]|nr:hypothetical protein [Bifidobacteriaceae bacterium]